MSYTELQTAAEVMERLLVTRERQRQQLDVTCTSLKCSLQALRDEIAKEAPKEAAEEPKKSKYTEPSANSNIGRAIAIIREAGPAGFTLKEIIERSAKNGQKVLKANSIGSQLMGFIHDHPGIIDKKGDNFYALKHPSA